MNKKNQTTIGDETILDTNRPSRFLADGIGSACLIAIHGEVLGKRFEIDCETLSIGRSMQGTITLSERSVSRNHCELKRDQDLFTMEDRNSTNGTFVNGEPIEKIELHDGDRIAVGRNVFKFLAGDKIEQAYHEEMYRLTTTDGLTGALNKAAFEIELDRECKRYTRYERGLSLVLIDVDRFKQINDSAGHMTGDRVLSKLARQIASTVRSNDVFGRIGGDEFAVLLPEMGLSAALEFAHRLCTMVRGSAIESTRLDFPVTLSIGVVQAAPETAGAKELFEAADRRLYDAKGAGRDCVRPDND
jgi:diguanylate cyclase (GGDEF)-like protein